ncbi:MULTISPECIES: HVO_2922 family protein [Halobellus]|uniref:HVO_2922 family protein n=1 Tax=Halobellus TaxID=1073986 RepID=UPI00210AC06C|nr:MULTISPECIES: HVO_2922 family protein [Halobellus]MDQ2053602.1 HVO_2922 family protein [Halobellus sp. H-GB7]
MTATFEVYEDQAGEYRWRLVHSNGNIIADSGEGYATKQKAKQGIESVKQNAPDADVVEAE